MKKRIIEIDAELAEIGKELSGMEARTGETGAKEEIDKLEARLNAATEERKGLVEAEDKRQTLLRQVAGSGASADEQIRSSLVYSDGRQQVEVTQASDPKDTPQYRKAFMEYVCRGTPIPQNMLVEVRAAGVTTTSEASAVIPSTILGEIIKKMESYGSVYNQVRKLNVKGGVQVPILTLRPEAKWIGEKTPSKDQMIKADEKITFSYYGLECKIAQTLLASVVTLDDFQRQFVPLAVEAMVKALEIGIFNGSGSGQMLGVLKDTRIPAVNKITLNTADFGTWSGWMTKVFAKMKKAYRDGMFFMAQGTFDGKINGMVDANGQPIGRVNYGIDGGEVYRFGGRKVETVEDAVLPSYEEAAVGDVVAVFLKLSDYVINSNLQMEVNKWRDHDTNQLKNQTIMIVDGKLLDANGVLLIAKGAAAAGA
jgi:HK97 family phage major capsid protein